MFETTWIIKGSIKEEEAIIKLFSLSLILGEEFKIIIGYYPSTRRACSTCISGCWTRLSPAIVPLQKVAQGGYVVLCHLQGLELAELVIGAEARHDLAQFVEGVIQAVHATPFARVRGKTPAFQDRW